MRFDDTIVLGIPGDLLDRDAAAAARVTAMIRDRVCAGMQVVAVVGAGQGMSSAATDSFEIASRAAGCAAEAAAALAAGLESAGVLARVGTTARHGPRTRGAQLAAEPRRVDVRAIIAEMSEAPVLVIPGGVGVDETTGAATFLGDAGVEVQAITTADRLTVPVAVVGGGGGPGGLPRRARLLADRLGLHPAGAELPEGAPLSAEPVFPLAEVISRIGRERVASVRISACVGAAAVFDQLAEGAGFGEAVERAVALGLFAGDAEEELAGVRAAVRLSGVLAEAFGVELAAGSIPRRGASAVSGSEIRRIARHGRRLRLIASLERGTEGRWAARGGPLPMRTRDPLASAAAGVAAAVITLRDGTSETVRGLAASPERGGDRAGLIGVCARDGRGLDPDDVLELSA